ncbi:MAG: PoNe immunity protein domain-containing protein, partial [Massilia sp.]
FGILLGRGDLLSRVVPLLDYNNPSRDGMLERLLAPYVDDRGAPPSDCTRQLPYYKTLKIFAAEADKRPNLMAEYLDEWYHASRREVYFDSHKRGNVFRGYWSWEAAAITFVLGIDDTSYRNAPFYPSDLVEFARQGQDRAARAQRLMPAYALRAKEGEPCPRRGQWSSLGIPAQTRYFEHREIMSNAGAPYALTVWTCAEPA